MGIHSAECGKWEILAVFLHAFESRQMLTSAKRHHRPREQIELHGEADPKAGPVLGGVLGQQAVRQGVAGTMHLKAKA